MNTITNIYGFGMIASIFVIPPVVVIFGCMLLPFKRNWHFKDIIGVAFGIALFGSIWPIGILLFLFSLISGTPLYSSTPSSASNNVQPVRRTPTQNTNYQRRSANHSGGINMAPKGSGLTTLWNDPDKSKIYVDPTALMEGTMGRDLDGNGRIGF